MFTTDVAIWAVRGLLVLGPPSVYDVWADLRDLMRRVRPDFDPTLPELQAPWAATH